MDNQLTAKDILLSAADILEEKGWCRGTLAKDRNGNPVPVESPVAEKFCLLGSVSKATNFKATIERMKAAEFLEKVIADISEPQSISKFNDDVCNDKRQAIRVLRKAAKLVEEQGENNGN